MFIQKYIPLSNRLGCQLLAYFMGFDFLSFSVDFQSKLRTFHFHLLLLLQSADTGLQCSTINDVLVALALQRKSFHFGGRFGDLTTMLLSKIQAKVKSFIVEWTKLEQKTHTCILWEQYQKSP